MDVAQNGFGKVTFHVFFASHTC